MNKESFNRYCVEVMQYKTATSPEWYRGDNLWVNSGAATFEYNPYDNLNQMAEVVEKILQNIESDDFPCSEDIYSKGFKQAFRDFIISTMEKE